MQEEQPLQVARCTKIIQDEKDSEKSKYVINVKQIAKFVVNLGERVSTADIEEGMRVGYVYCARFEFVSLTFGAVLTATNIKFYSRFPQRSTHQLR
jgi:proteasome regulatory subunit 7-like protein